LCHPLPRANAGELKAGCSDADTEEEERRRRGIVGPRVWGKAEGAGTAVRMMSRAINAGG
jgi:hypothetical protein